MSDSLWLQGLQPRRLLGPWDFPGMNTGVGCYILLQGYIMLDEPKPNFALNDKILLWFQSDLSHSN